LTEYTFVLVKTSAPEIGLGQETDWAPLLDALEGLGATVQALEFEEGFLVTLESNEGEVHLYLKPRRDEADAMHPSLD